MPSPNLPVINYVATDPDGTVLANVHVAVLVGAVDTVDTSTIPGSPLATLYADVEGTIPIANPVMTDGLGRITVCPSVPGWYVLWVYGVNVTYPPQLVQKFATNVISSSPTFGVNVVNVKQFGAVGSGKAAYGSAVISASSHSLTLVAPPDGIAEFSLADVGKTIRVTGAGTAGADLFTTIASYISPTNVTLTAAAITSIDQTDTYWWPVGSDDTTAIQDAINAATVANGIVYFPAGVYPVSAPLTNSFALQGCIGDGVNLSYVVNNIPTVAGDTFDFTDVPYGFTLHDMTVIGNGSKAAGSANSVSLNLSQSTGVVERLDMHNFRAALSPGYGFYAQCVIVSNITNCIMDGNVRGIFLDKEPFGGFGGTSVNFNNIWTPNCTYGYYLENYTYCTFNGCASDGTNYAYFLSHSGNIVLNGCGAESLTYVDSGNPGVGFTISHSQNIVINGAYFFNAPNIASIGVQLISGNSCVINAYQGSPLSIIPTYDIVIDGATNNTVIINPIVSGAGINSSINDGGGNTFVQTGGEFTKNLNFLGNLQVQGTTLLQSSLTAHGVIDFTNDVTIGGIIHGNQTLSDNLHVEGNVDFHKAFQAGTPFPVWAPTISSSNVSFISGWGTSPSINFVSGFNPAGAVGIICGTTPSANPVLRLTFSTDVNQPFGTAPIVVVSRYGDNTIPTAEFRLTNITSTYFEVTLEGTPIGGGSYAFNFMVQGLG